jgi:hypothetical protein
LVSEGRNAEALTCFVAAQEADRDHAGLQAARGVALYRLGRAVDALTAYTTALQQMPGDADTWLNLGVLYQSDGHTPEALSCFETALGLRPAFVDGWANRAKAQRALGDIDGALASFEAALRLEPDSATLRLDRAMCHLMLGDTAAGWPGYEARLAIKAEPPILPGRWPVWQGEPLDGRRIAVVSEQGLGDTIQFARFIAPLSARGADVTFRVAPEMIPLLGGLVPKCRLVAGFPDEADFDFEIAVMSLPARLAPDAIAPLDPPRYLRVETARVMQWRRLLDNGSGRLRIGIAWQGNPNFIDDGKRSIPLAHFAGLARLTDVDLISLQMHAGAEQIATSDFAVVQPGVDFAGIDFEHDGAFVDTAAIIETLDLVITSDSAIAHLAGALGRPVWLALPSTPDWRWGMTGETTHWYSTMRLFRQSVDGDWGGVFATIRDTFEAEFSRTLP